MLQYVPPRVQSAFKLFGPMPTGCLSDGAAVRGVSANGRRCPTPEFCCLPSGCVRYADERIDPREPGDAVKVVCSNPACTVGTWMHADCFEDWEQRVLFYVRCCEGGGRSNLDGRQRAAAASGWPLARYEMAIRACVCICGKGTLRKDCRYLQPVVRAPPSSDLSPVGAALLYYPLQQQQQQHRAHLLLQQQEHQRLRTCSFSSTGSSSAGSAATPPLSPPRSQAFFPVGVSTPPPQSVTPPRSAMRRMDGPLATSSCTPSPPQQPLPVKLPPPPVLPPPPGGVHRPARGNIFVHRSDLSGFRSAVRRSAQNAYHIRLDDDGPHGNDDIRSFLMRRLSAAGVREMACVSCRCRLPVYDEFPLVDGTFFLSPRPYDRPSTCGAGSAAQDQSAAVESIKLDSIAVGQRSTFAGPVQQLQGPKLSLPVVFNRRLLYLHAVCLACLGTASASGDGCRGSRDASAPVNRVECRWCNAPWTAGAHLVLGTMYTYDVFASVPCCARRQACTRCGGQPVGSEFDGGAGGASTPDAARANKSFSDFSKLAKCGWCGLEDYLYVRPFDESFRCAGH